MLYECIINKNVLLQAHAGVSCLLKSGLYDTDRKGIGTKPFIELKRSVKPLVSVGVSYKGLFK